MRKQPGQVSAEKDLGIVGPTLTLLVGDEAVVSGALIAADDVGRRVDKA